MTRKIYIFFINLKQTAQTLGLSFMFFLFVVHQVSVEPEGGSYVFQGFIQGKDYGQFGLQRLGMCLFKFNKSSIAHFSTDNLRLNEQ